MTARTVLRSGPYPHSGSLNLVIGMVGLTFSCDGAHYLPADEFLAKDGRFWLGA